MTSTLVTNKYFALDEKRFSLRLNKKEKEAKTGGHNSCRRPPKQSGREESTCQMCSRKERER